jgi:hypothetical protein
MRPPAEHVRQLPILFQAPRLLPISDDLKVACLFAAVGLSLTAVFFALGFGADVGQLLADAG